MQEALVMIKRFAYIFFTISVLFIPTKLLYAYEIAGEGHGKNIEKARNDALSTLAKNIYVMVESKTFHYQSSKGEDEFHVESKHVTSVPLLRAKFSCNEDSANYLCVATLDSKISLQAYEQKITEIVNNINANYAKLSFIEKNKKGELLLDINAQYIQYQKLLLVGNILSQWKLSFPKPKPTAQKISSLITEQVSSIKSLKMAAKFLTKDITQTDIYVKPVTLKSSTEITPFASALAQEVKSNLHTVRFPRNANYILEGGYIENTDSIQVSYSLSDRFGDTLKSVVVNLQPQSYKNYRTKPLAPDFDQLLHNGYAVSSKFKVHLVTNKGMRDLVFQSGETVKLLMKMNRSGYFYLVGHTKNRESEQSYLLELGNGIGDRRFISYVNADDVNKWISLGKFEVDEPFGIESLQLMASTGDAYGKLPSYQYESNGGYYVISNNIKKGIRKTRGLKKMKEKNMSFAESVLLFTTEK